MRKYLLFLALSACIGGIAQPAITSFSPSSGIIGTAVTVTGTNFSSTLAANTVYFGAVKAEITAATATSLTVKVPLGATYQPISITTNGLTAYSRLPFIVTFSSGYTRFTDSMFAAKMDFTVAKPIMDICVNDFNGDGKTDCIVGAAPTDGSITFSVLKNTSTPKSVSFTAQADIVLAGSFPFNANRTNMKAADIDGDGKIDIVTNDGNLNKLLFFLNTSAAGGNISFSKTETTFSDGPRNIEIADIDRDGKPDLIVQSSVFSRIALFINTSTPGNISFAAQRNFTTDGLLFNLTISDLDGNGKVDLLALTSLATVWSNNSTPGNVSFSTGTITRPYGNTVTACDINNDGKPDLLSNSAFGIHVTKNTSTAGNISFDPAVEFIAESNTTGFCVGDLDGDGKIDYAGKGESGNVMLLKNKSTTTTLAFDAKKIFTTGNSISSFIADIDNDSIPDLILTNAAQGIVSVMRNRAHAARIFSFSPANARINDTVTVNGINFSGTTAVTIAGIAPAGFNVVSDSVIKIVVGANAVNGVLKVVSPQGVDSLAGFILVRSPKIYSFIPASAKWNDTISIKGKDLSTVNAVYLGNTVAGSFTVNNDSTITVIAGKVSSGNVKITSTIGNDSVPGFIYIMGVKLTAVVPMSGTVGSSVVISGKQFSTVPSENIVYFGSAKAVVTAASTDSLVVTVPTGMTYEPISVTVGKLTVYSSLPFNVITPGSVLNRSTFIVQPPDTVFGSSSPLVIFRKDLDGDGRPDLVTRTNQDKAPMNVYRNTSKPGTVSWAAKQEIMTGTSLGSVAFGDFDGDGKPDMVIGERIPANAIYILKNTSSAGNISFASRITYPITTSTVSGNWTNIEVADLNNDGKPDIVAVCDGSNVFSIFLNTSVNGVISFSNRQDINPLPGKALSYGIEKILLADMNKDGNIDILINTGPEPSPLFILKNTMKNGLLSFTDSAQTIIPNSKYLITTADIDADGKLDIIIKGLGQTSVLKNTSSTEIISFTLQNTFVSTSNYVLALDNFDGDGKPDMISGATTPEPGNSLLTFNIYANTNSSPDKYPGTAVPYFVYAGYASGITTADFDGDGTQDIALIGGNVSILTRRMTPPPPVINSFSPSKGPIGTTVIIKGLNFMSDPGKNIVRFGQVTAKVTAATDSTLTVTVPTGANFQGIHVTVNNLTGYTDRIFQVTFPEKGYGLIKTSFTNDPKDSISLPLNVSLLFPADLDGDGKPDLAAIDKDTSLIYILMNTGSPKKITWAPKQDISAGTVPTDIVFSDIDGDGKPDMIVANQGSNTISVFLNTSVTGKISFAKRTDYAILGAPKPFANNYSHRNMLAVRDIDNDGKPDIVATAYLSATLFIFMNKSTPGNVLFADRKDLTPRAPVEKAFTDPRDIALADINNDGKADLIVTDDKSGKVWIMRNFSTEGNPYFGDVTIAWSSILLSRFPTQIRMGDIDGDGNTDISCTDESYQHLITVLNYKPSKDTAFIFSDEAAASMNGYAFSVDNLDGDGKPDMTFAGFDAATVSFLNNTSSAGNTSFASTIAQREYKSSATGMATADFDGDGRQDIAICATKTLDFFRNTIDEIPCIKSLSSTSGGYGTPITIKGYNFTNATVVKFTNVPAASFKVESDTVITAVIGKSAFGNVYVSNENGADSLGNFSFLSPEIKILPATLKGLSFPVADGKYSRVQQYAVSGRYLWDSLEVKVNAGHVELSLKADTGFAKSVKLNPVKGTIDSTNIYIRFKGDNAISSFDDSIYHYSYFAPVVKLGATGQYCDTVVAFTPAINNIVRDSLICFRTPVTLAIPNSSTKFAVYRWSTGQTTETVTIDSSQRVTLQVGTTAACLSNPSAQLRLVKTVNPVPTLALSGEFKLVSSSAPAYRWYNNNILLPGEFSSSLLVNKNGFYKVETSQDRLCWDASNEFPMLFVPTAPGADTIGVRAYPNPSTGTFNVVATLQRVSNVIVKVTVTDVSGNTLLQTNKFIFIGKEIKIPVTLSAKGTVFVKVDVNGDVKTISVIMQ